MALEPQDDQGTRFDPLINLVLCVNFYMHLCFNPSSHLSGRTFIDSIGESLTLVNLCWHRSTLDCITFHNHCMGGMWGINTLSRSTCVNLIVYPSIWIRERPDTPNHSTISYLSMFLLFSFHLHQFSCITLCCIYHFTHHLSPHTNYPLLISSLVHRNLGCQLPNGILGHQSPWTRQTPFIKLYIPLHFDDTSNGAVAGD